MAGKPRLGDVGLVSPGLSPVVQAADQADGPYTHCFVSSGPPL